jgi:NAD+ kinase
MPKIAFIYAETTESHAFVSIQHERLNHIRATLKQAGFAYDAFVRDHLPPSLDGYDFVLAVGGDGTQLEAASRLTHTPLCAVRLLPEKSVGFLCKLDFSEVEAFIQRYQAGKAHLESIPRLQCVIDGMPLPYAILNDVLITNACPARATRFSMAFRQTEASVCSSGIWVATQPGSHGAAKAAGAMSLMPESSEMAVYCLRECARIEQQSPDAILKWSTFTPNTESPVIRLEDNNSVLYLDGGLVQQALKQGQTVKFQRHEADWCYIY